MYDYYSENPDDPENPIGWKTSRIRGYVVALKDASTDKGCWPKKQLGNLDNPHTQYLTTTFEESSTKPLETKNYSGYINTFKIISEDPYGMYSSSDVTNGAMGMWAFKVAVEYKTIVPAPSNSSGWYLPSIRQLIDLCNVYNIRQYLEGAGGIMLQEGPNSSEGYWSCTEIHGTKNMCSSAFGYNYAQSNHLSMNKNGGTLYVRSVLTF